MTTKGTVMIVDDDVDLLEELSDMLTLSDYRVVPCADAAAAVRIASQNKPDAVLIDILMPSMNGLQVVDELRRCADTARTPVIMMSGRCTESEGGTLARINRFAGFVQKPISPFALFSLLEKIIL